MEYSKKCSDNHKFLGNMGSVFQVRFLYVLYFVLSADGQSAGYTHKVYFVLPGLQMRKPMPKDITPFAQDQLKIVYPSLMMILSMYIMFYSFKMAKKSQA